MNNLFEMLLEVLQFQYDTGKLDENDVRVMSTPSSDVQILTLMDTPIEWFFSYDELVYWINRNHGEMQIYGDLINESNKTRTETPKENSRF